MATILIVDDQPVNRQLLSTLLRYSGHRLLEAADGTEALERVRAERPSLVIADVLMPTMDGYEFVRQLRGDTATAPIPVIFYTAAYNDEEARNLAKTCGVSHVITKPADPEVILGIVTAALNANCLPASKFEQFDREHLRLITDKLSEKVNDLEVANFRLAALADVARELASERDPLRLLDALCPVAREMTGARYAAVGLVDQGDQRLRHFSISGMDRETVALLQPPSLGSGLLARLLNRRQVVRLRDIGDDALATGFPAPRHSTRSFLGVPLALPDEFLGVLYLVERLGTEEFGLEDERVTVALAAQGAVAYEYARRYEEIQRHSAELQREMIERQRAEKALHQLSGRLLQVQDEERRRIARELHDTTAQNLAGLQMALSFVNDSADDLKPSARQALSDGIALANECLREIRTLSYLLHPPLLDDAGLLAALRAYSAGYTRRTGVEVNLDVPFELGRLPREVEVTLFRIVQEALGNVHRHSGSKTADVRLTLTATEILLEVIDQGYGMLPGILDRTINGKALLGVGIAGMQERVAQLEGRLEIDSSSDGTTVSVVLPVRGDKVWGRSES